MGEVIARRVFERVLPDRRYVRASAKLEQIGGNARPHFSLTGEEWKSKRHYERNEENGRETGLYCLGAMGEQLVKWMPKLALIERLHLADDTGAPMHAVENGWYWYSDFDGAGVHSLGHGAFADLSPHGRAAHHLRVDPGELPEGLDKAEFIEYVETLRPRWQAEADQARAFLAERGTEVAE